MTDTEREALSRLMLTGMTTDWHTLSRAVRERDALRARLDEIEEKKTRGRRDGHQTD